MGQKTHIWMPLYIGDYLADTQHLSAEQSGGYLHLLMHAWKAGPLPADLDALRRIARIEPDAWSNAWTMLKVFFQQNESGNFIQKRLERERFAWNAKKAASVAKATLAANKRHHGSASSTPPSNAPSNAQGNAQALLGTCPSPLPIKDTPASQDYECFRSAWNENRGSLAEVEKLTTSRTAKLKSRIAEGLTVERLALATSKSASTPFLRGEGSQAFA